MTRIAIFTQERDICALIEETLKLSNYDVLCTENADVFFKSLVKSQVDGGICDIDYLLAPIQRGDPSFTAAALVFAKERLRLSSQSSHEMFHTGVIALTTADILHDVVSCAISETGSRVVQKPFDLDVLLEAVESVVVKGIG